MSLIITKVSGVIFVQSSATQNPKSYFGAVGNYQPSDDNTTISISITQAGQSIPDTYTVAFASLTVGTSTPTTMSSAKILLNAIFGT